MLYLGLIMLLPSDSVFLVSSFWVRQHHLQAVILVHCDAQITGRDDLRSLICPSTSQPKMEFSSVSLVVEKKKHRDQKRDFRT